MDDIDQLLASESTIEPSVGFSSRVMAAVQHAALAPAPIPFPWRFVVFGSAALVAVLVALPWLPFRLDLRGSSLGSAIERAGTSVDPISLAIVVCLGCLTFATIHRARSLVEHEA